MTPTTQYYGAEIQNVQVQVIQSLSVDGAAPQATLFVFNQKVLSDTFTVKYSQSATSPINLSTVDVELNYKPILVQLGQGGPAISDAYGYVRSGFGTFYIWDNNEAYNPNGLLKTKAISNVTSSIAGNLMEVTCVYSLILSTPTVSITGVATT
jgi:hypothetical protein